MNEQQISEFATLKANVVHILGAVDEVKKSMERMATKDDIRMMATRGELEALRVDFTSELRAARVEFQTELKDIRDEAKRGSASSFFDKVVRVCTVLIAIGGAWALIVAKAAPWTAS